MADIVNKMWWRMFEPRHIEIEVQGSLLKMRELSPRNGTRKASKSSRGIVTHFSRKSRKRMIDLMARLDRKKIAWGRQKPKFITLTYEDNVTDHKKAARDMKVFAERIQEHYPDAAMIWRKEQQERGAIHFHLMVFNVPHMLIHTKNGVKGWQQHWNEVSGNPEDNKNSLDIEVIRSMNGVMFYVAKYMAKAEDEPDESKVDDSDWIVYNRHGREVKSPQKPSQPELGLSMLHNLSQQSTGRWWGVYGRKFLPLATKIKKCFHVPLATVDMWIEQHVKSGWASTERSWTVYSSDALERFDGIYKIMAMAASLHDEMYFGHYQSLHEQTALECRSDFMPAPLWEMWHTAKYKAKKIVEQVKQIQATEHHNLTRLYNMKKMPEWTVETKGKALQKVWGLDPI